MSWFTTEVLRASSYCEFSGILSAWLIYLELQSGVLLLRVTWKQFVPLSSYLPFLPPSMAEIASWPPKLVFFASGQAARLHFSILCSRLAHMMLVSVTCEWRVVGCALEFLRTWPMMAPFLPSAARLTHEDVKTAESRDRTCIRETPSRGKPPAGHPVNVSTKGLQHYVTEIWRISVTAIIHNWPCFLFR